MHYMGKFCLRPTGDLPVVAKERISVCVGGVVPPCWPVRNHLLLFFKMSICEESNLEEFMKTDQRDLNLLNTF